MNNTYPYLLNVNADTTVEADKVVGERVSYDEDYGFPYSIGASYITELFVLQYYHEDSSVPSTLGVFSDAESAKVHLFTLLTEGMTEEEFGDFSLDDGTVDYDVIAVPFNPGT